MIYALSLFIVFFPNLIFRQIVESTDKTPWAITLAYWTLSLIALHVVVWVAGYRMPPPESMHWIFGVWALNALFGRRLHPDLAVYAVREHYGALELGIAFVLVIGFIGARWKTFEAVLFGGL